MAGKRKRSQKSTEGVAPDQSKCKLSSAHITVENDSHNFEVLHLETKRASAIKDTCYRRLSPKSQQQSSINTAALSTVTDHHIHSCPTNPTTITQPSCSHSTSLQNSTSFSPSVRHKRRRLNSLSCSDGTVQQVTSSNNVFIERVKNQHSSGLKYSVQQQPNLAEEGSSSTKGLLELPRVKNKTRYSSHSSHSKYHKRHNLECDSQLHYLRSVQRRTGDSTVEQYTRNVHLASFGEVDCRGSKKKRCEHRTKLSVPQFSDGQLSVDHGAVPYYLSTASDMPIVDTDGNSERAKSRSHSHYSLATCPSYVPPVASFGLPEVRDQPDPRLANHDLTSWRPPPPRVFVIPDFPSLAASNRFPRSHELDSVSQASDIDPSLIHDSQIGGSSPLDLTIGMPRLAGRSWTNRQRALPTGVVHPNSLDASSDDANQYRCSRNKDVHRGTVPCSTESSLQTQNVSSPEIDLNPAVMSGTSNASAFVVTPLSTGITYPGPTPSVQQLLNPTNMARLISLGASVAAGRSNVSSFSSSSSNLVNDPLSCETAPAVTNRPLRIPGTHASSQSNYAAPSKTGAQIDLAQWRATVAPWWVRSCGPASGSSGSGPSHHPMGRHSPHSTSINQRIAQLQQSQLDRSVQLVILQDINQILLIGYEETLFHLNVEGLVNCILDILSSEDEQHELAELKNLSCTVLTHMMDALPHSSSAVVPALPLLLTTMSCSFVGDILERIINLMEQLSRRHGRDVLQSGGIAAIMSFYDFVTLAQHRTILTMIANCFSELRSTDADFALIANCLPNLSERLRESEPRCVERVCTCFLRLVIAYRLNPLLLKRIVTSCNLFSNLQHLLVASPPILSACSVRDVVHMLSMMCSSCPDLTVDLIKQGIAGTLYTTLVGRSVNLNELRDRLLSPITGISWDYEAHIRHTRRRSKRACSQSRASVHPTRSTSRKRQLSEDATTVDQTSNTVSLCPAWQPLMLLTPFPLHTDSRSSEWYDLSVTQRSPQNIHVIVQLICELLPPIPSAYTTLLICEPQQSSDSHVSVCSVNTPDTLDSPSPVLLDTINLHRALTDPVTHSVPQSPMNKSCPTVPIVSERRRRRSGARSGSQRLPLSIGSQSQTSSPTCSSNSSTTLSATLGLKNCSSSVLQSDSYSDPRAQLLHRECEQLYSLLESTVTQPMSLSEDQTKQNSRRRSQNAPQDKAMSIETATGNVQAPSSNHDAGDFEAVQLVQILLPLLFELLTETTRSQTRLRCLEAIQRMVFHSSPILLAKVLHPRIVCSHIVGMLNSPEQCVVLSELQIALMLLDRVPLMFATYFRKEGILHLVSQLVSGIIGSSPTTAPPPQHQPPFNWMQLSDVTEPCKQSTSDVRRNTTMTGFINSCDDSIPLTATSSCTSRTRNPYPWAVPSSLDPKIAVHTVEKSSSCNPPLFIASSDSISLLASAVLSPKQVKGNRGEDKSQPIPPNSLYHLERCSLKPGDAMSYWIHRACLQLQSRLTDLTMTDHHHHTSSDQVTSEPVVEHVSADLNHNLLPYSIDLMPKLKMIVTHLQSTQPALWLFSLTHLIKLLLPSTKLQTEPPSPFELHYSGLTTALLNFLTTPDSHCLRLWMFCRLFFSLRCKNSDVRFPPLTCAPNPSHKKHSSSASKNFLQLSCPGPVALTQTQANQLKEFDSFIDTQLSDMPETRTNDPYGTQAFSALLVCLLAYFHRHEHFQVRGLPSLLPSGSQSLSLLNHYPARRMHDVSNKDNTSEFPSNNPPTSPIGSQPSTRTNQKSSTFRILGRSTRNHPLPPIALSEPLEAASVYADVTTVPPPSYAMPVSHAVRPLIADTVTPTAGVLWLNLQRISDEPDCVSGDFTTGGSTRTNRKSTSSSSSVSSNYSSSSTISAEATVAIPVNFTLPITALATFQHLERLLIQRNYISSVLTDGGLSHDHDYFSPLISYPNTSRLTLVDDLERLIGANRNGLNLMTSSDVYDQMATLRPAIHGKPKLPGFEAAFPTPLLNTLVGSVTDNPEEIRELSKQSELLVSNSEQLRSSSLQETQQSSTRNLSSTQGALQRGLRSLLQRGTDVLPIVTKSSIEKNDTASASTIQSESSEMTVASVPSAIRFVRRRSTTNIAMDSSSYGAVSESISDSSKTPSKSRSNPSSSSYSLRYSSSNNQSCIAATSDEMLPQSTTSGNVSKNRITLATRIPHKPDNTVTSNRHRRLKGSSILAAFGALSNLSSNSHAVSSSGTSQRGSARSSGVCASVSEQSGTNRQVTIKSSPSTSSSTSNSSMSPIGPDNSATRVKHRLSIVFYIDNHQVPSQMPLFQALRKFSADISHQLNFVAKTTRESSSVTNRTGIVQPLGEPGIDDIANHLMWSMMHTIRYRFVRTSCIKESHNRASSGSKKSDMRGSHGGLHLFGYRHGLQGTGKATDHQQSGLSSEPHSSLSVSMNCIKRRRSDETHPTPSGSVALPLGSTGSVDTRFSWSSESGNASRSVCHPLLSELIPCLPFGDSAHRISGEQSGDPSVSSDPAVSVDSTNPHCASIFSKFIDSTDLTNTLDNTTTNTLSLLRVLHRISRLWYTVRDLLDPHPAISSVAFRSAKLSVKARRQLQDVFSVLAGNLPQWLVQLISTCPFLFPFEVRRTFFYSYNFDRDRTLLRFQENGSSLSDLSSLPQVSGLGRQTASRSSTSASSTSAQHGDYYIPSSSGTLSPSSTANNGSVLSDVSASAIQTTSVNPNCEFLSGILQELDVAHSSSCYVTGSLSGHHGINYQPQRQVGHPRTHRVRYHTRLAMTPNIRRHKMTVIREGKQLLRQAETTFTEMLDSRAMLEIAFEGEVGFGLGPTLEFYTLVSRQLMQANLNLWYGSEVTKDGHIVAPSPGLYPRPLAKQARSSVAREIRNKFLFIGRLLARSLMDWRQLDLPLSTAFFKWFLAPNAATAISTGRILPNDLALIDPDLSQHINHLAALANQRQNLLDQLERRSETILIQTAGIHCNRCTSSQAPIPADKNESDTEQQARKLKDCLTAIDNEIEQLYLTFVLPGYEIELVKNGNHVSVSGSNIGDYIRLVSHWLVIEGARLQMEAVLEGFDSVLPGVRQQLALLFEPHEMEGLFCGLSSQSSGIWLEEAGMTKYSGGPFTKGHNMDSEFWDVQTLTEACQCDHGYTAQSRTIRNLFEVMSAFNDEQRRLFVQFVTGSPRLPVGGFRALKPPLKIVMKREHGDSADSHLPSVMTCQNYLKLPDYSTKELLCEKVLYAICEGQNAFHLS